MQLNTEQLLDIKSIIEFGTRKPEVFQIPFLDGKNDSKVSVKIRGLSNYEYDIINIDMYSETKDKAVIDYIFNSEPEPEEPEEDLAITIDEDGKEITINNEIEKNKINVAIEKDENEYPEGVSSTEILKAILLRDVLIVYYSMKDFYADLTLSSVKQIDNITSIAERVNEKSGKSKKSKDNLEFFRDESDKSNPKVSNT